MIKPPHLPRLSSYKRYDPGPVFANTVENFHERNDTWAIGCCPFHDDRHPSFTMNVETGWYRCNSTHCGATGSSIVSFVSRLYGLDTRAALEFLEAYYG